MLTPECNIHRRYPASLYGTIANGAEPLLLPPRRWDADPCGAMQELDKFAGTAVIYYHQKGEHQAALLSSATIG